MVKLQVILGSTRPGRIGAEVAEWVQGIVAQREGVTAELVDVADYNLPLLDEPVPPSLNRYSQEHTKTWGAKIAEADGYIFVTAEYNHSIPGALKNAIDYLYAEWNNKAAGFVSYGSANGVRAVEQLRQVMGEIQIADVRAQVMLGLASDFKDYKAFTPQAGREGELNALLDQLVPWAEAMKGRRQA